MRIINIFFLSSLLLPLLLSGCLSTTKKYADNSQNESGAYNKSSAQLLTQNELGQLEVNIKDGSDENTLIDSKYQVQDPPQVQAAALAQTGELKNVTPRQKNAVLPDNAKPGECYARVLIPEKYRSATKKVLINPATYAIEKIPAQYKWVDERVLVKEASESVTTIPAEYAWKTESVLAKESTVQLKTIPAVYEDKTTKVLVKAAYTTWKKGRGPMEKINNATGEIMCLVEVPAEYKTVTKKVVITPEKTEKIMLPAVYKDVKKQVMVKPEEKNIVTIPAEYKTIKVKKVVVPAQQRRVEIPALYGEAVEQVKVSDSHHEWRKILCETNTTPNVVYKLQNALQALGYYSGKSDGIIGAQTMIAVQRYQQEKEIAEGQITIETLKSLGVID